MAQEPRSWQPVTLGPDAPVPIGAYSRGARAGRLLFVSGQTPRDPATGAVVGSSIAPQARQTLDNVRRVLGAAGATMDDVVSVTVYLTDVSDWDALNVVYREFFHEPFPTRTVVGVELRGILVEISAVAYPRPGS